MYGAYGMLMIFKVKIIIHLLYLYGAFIGATIVVLSEGWLDTFLPPFLSLQPSFPPILRALSLTPHPSALLNS